MTTTCPVDLPPVIDQPIDRTETPLEKVLEKHPLLAEAIGDENIFCCVKSRTCVDVGYWFIKRRVWVLAMRDELLLLAPGKFPLIERVPFAKLSESIYNHVTGSLALAPSKPVGTLKMSPIDGYQLLAQIYQST